MSLYIPPLLLELAKTALRRVVRETQKDSYFLWAEKLAVGEVAADVLVDVLADLDNNVSESKALKKHDLPVDAGSALRTINQHLSM